MTADNDATPAVAVKCPNCESEDFQELAYRHTWQPVVGLKSDGDANSYGEFDYGDDVLVVGWECRDCDWSAEGDMTPVHEALAVVYQQALEQLKAAATS